MNVQTKFALQLLLFKHNIVTSHIYKNIIVEKCPAKKKINILQSTTKTNTTDESCEQSTARDDPSADALVGVLVEKASSSDSWG